MDTKELESILNGKSEKSTASKIWTITKCLSECAWIGGKFIAKNTPTVLGAAWQIKKEISDNVAQAIHEVNQKQKVTNLDNMIDSLKNNSPIKSIKDKANTIDTSPHKAFNSVTRVADSKARQRQDVSNWLTSVTKKDYSHLSLFSEGARDKLKEELDNLAKMSEEVKEESNTETK